MKKAIFPGSFDLLHIGHINIIKRASKLFDKLYVVVSQNVSKVSSTDITKRFEYVKKQVKKLKLKNVEVKINNFLTIDMAKKLKCQYIIRSIRNTKDYLYEEEIARTNHKLSSNIETILFFADEQLKKISSTNIQKIKQQLLKIKK